MARMMDADATEVFRVVVAATYADDAPYFQGRTFTSSYGPYMTRAAAASRITQARRYAPRGATVTGRVERAVLTWETVLEK